MLLKKLTQSCRNQMPNWELQPERYEPCVRKCVQLGRHREGYCEQHCMPHIEAVMPLPRPQAPVYDYHTGFFQSYPMRTQLVRQYLNMTLWPTE